MPASVALCTARSRGDRALGPTIYSSSEESARTDATWVSQAGVYCHPKGLACLLVDGYALLFELNASQVSWPNFLDRRQTGESTLCKTSLHLITTSRRQSIELGVRVI